jgi:hypothetical protein
MLNFSPALVGLTPEREMLLDYVEIDKFQLQPRSVSLWKTQPPPRTLIGTYTDSYYEQIGMNGLPSIDFLEGGNLINTPSGPLLESAQNLFFLRLAKDHELRSLFAFFEVQEHGDGMMTLFNNSFVNEKHYTDPSVKNLIYPWVGNPVKVGWRFDYMVGTDNQNSAAYGKPENAYFRIFDGAKNHDKIILRPSNRNLFDPETGICEFNASDPKTRVWLSIYCLPDTGSKNYNSSCWFNPFTKTITFKAI